MEKTFYNTEHASLSLENDIIKVVFKKGPITLDIAKKIVNQRLSFTDKANFPVLITDNGKGISSLDRDAREFMGTGIATTGISASAFLTNSPLNKYIINFFLRIASKQTSFPAKIFSNEEEAIKWLENFVEKK